MSKIGFTISIEKAQSQRKSSSLAHPPVPHLVGGRDTGGSGEEEKMRVLFKCVPGEVPAEGGSSRALVLEGVGGSGVVAVRNLSIYLANSWQFNYFFNIFSSSTPTPRTAAPGIR